MNEDISLATVGNARPAELVALYLDMVKRTLTDKVYWDDPLAIYRFWRPRAGIAPWKRHCIALLERLLNRSKIRLVKPYFVPWYGDYSQLSRKGLAEIPLKGNHWPVRAHTMIGLKRLDNIQFCVETAIREKVPGDVIETGVWRGGACIFMRAILKAHGDTERAVWLADSFAGLPPPDAGTYPADVGDPHHTFGDYLAVSRQEVEENFRRYDLLDGQVRFLEGWFKDTLPKAPINRLAVLRLDGDMYESTTQALESLYDRVSPGGFVIIDDYHLEPCKQAVTDFRSRRSINDAITDIDGMGVFWRKSH